MSEILQPGQGILFMKVGTHADEPLEQIITRKRLEIARAGFGLWGYGGNTCHPLTRVQPFAQDFVRRGEVIYLCMHPMTSHHFAVTKRATEYSADGVEWTEIPEAINVIGSRYALAIKDLRNEDFDLPLSRTRVAVGTSIGRRGDEYISGRVDKACLEIGPEVPEAGEHGPAIVKIGLVAELVEPFAVIVR